MKKPFASICLAVALSSIVMAQAPAAAPAAPAAKGKPDLSILHVQVLLDRLGFTPGVIDGLGGQSLTLALKGFQQARGIPATGKIDPATLKVLNAYKETRPTVIVTLTAEDLAGPFVGPLPKDPAEQAKLPSLGYANPMEMLGERFHTTPATLVALNSPETRIAPGAKISVPNVVPVAVDYPADLKDDWKKTLASLNVDSNQPKADHLVVDESDGVLRVYDAGDKVIAQFPATMGSSHDPLPIGTWKVQGASYNPQFHYNPKLFWDANKSKSKELLPPGPNGPVGVVWLDLDKPHYGIHGTPSPETIGRAESHGCIRLTNWDAARLSLMVKPGTKAVFQK